MKHRYILILLSAICLCASCNTNKYILKGSLQATKELTGKNHKEINSHMNSYGWNYTEHPNISTNDHPDGKHCEVIFDKELDEYIFRFSIHANATNLDGDRGKKDDRQRNEMKSQTSNTPMEVQTARRVPPKHKILPHTPAESSRGQQRCATDNDNHTLRQRWQQPPHTNNTHRRHTREQPRSNYRQPATKRL